MGHNFGETNHAAGLSINLKKVSQQFSEKKVLNEVDLDIAAGEFVTLVGSSGCGKSTLLRLLSQLDQPSSGELGFGNQQQQQIRVMFQDPRLLPWKRVIDNVGLGLSGAWQEKAYQVLEEVGLADKVQEWPARLSGGQKQRVALARALIHQPQLLLLDEPLGALDALTRLDMQQLIENLWQRHGFTVVLVTHDVNEAVKLADRVILLEGGKVGLDLKINLARPRSAAQSLLVEYEQKILHRILVTPQSVLPPPAVTKYVSQQWQQLRWAI